MEPHERLNAALARRIDELDLTWQELATATGVHGVTLRAIRRGENRPSSRTKRRLDDALQWERGSVDEILAGGEPTPIGGHPETVEQIADQVDSDLAAMGDQIRQAIERSRGKALTETQRRIVIEWSDVLERTIDAMDEEAG